MMNTKLGIFGHFMAFHTGFAPVKPNPNPWDLNALVDTFDVQQFADAVEDMGAQGEVHQAGNAGRVDP